MLNIGYIDYLNCYPFYYHMYERKNLKGVVIQPGYPSDLNREMAKGTLDLSPISAAALPDITDPVSILPDYCLSSLGYVGSVVLRSRVPIESLDNKTIGLTCASKTSVILLKIILQEYYGIMPEYHTTSPDPDMDEFDAVLVIGNDAMLPQAKPVQFSYDLGELWLRKTGFPVVFALFVVRDLSIRHEYDSIQAVINSYSASIDMFHSHPDLIIRKARKKYPHIIYDIKSYYDLLKFNFTNQMKEALFFYLEKAGEMNLVNQNTKIRFME